MLRIYLVRRHQPKYIYKCIILAGKYTVFEGVKLLENLSWGIAGRNKEKLESVLKEMGEKAKTDLSSIPIIIADVSDENSLKTLAESAKVRDLLFVSVILRSDIIFFLWFRKYRICIFFVFFLIVYKSELMI